MYPTRVDRTPSTWESDFCPHQKHPIPNVANPVFSIILLFNANYLLIAAARRFYLPD
jgi:hypothetical protein